jgi:hypothetical protein
MGSRGKFFAFGFVCCLSAAACGSKGKDFSDGGDNLDGDILGDGNIINNGDGGTGFDDTCTGAAMTKSYVGCDYWPTVIANNVWSIFDFAVVVANATSKSADITITGPGTNQMGSVPPGGLQKFYLPWVSTLKGPDADQCGAATPLTASVVAKNSAYHLVSTVPVTVYQFNALEYKGMGGPQGKNWGACPGNQICPTYGMAVGCFSFSNDASLLLPSTAMTGNYRVAGQKGWTVQGMKIMGPTFAITATQNGTTVTVKTSATSQVIAGGGIPTVNGAGNFTLQMNAGDVAEVVGQQGDQDDFSGSLVQATQPVQVITGMPCVDQPENVQACDHIEESVFPAETLGQHYIVTVPTSPLGNVVGHIVRVYGNVNGTTLSYSPQKPAQCPTSINAGQVVDCGQVAQDFEIKGNHEFAVGSFQLGGTLVDPMGGKGDPSESFAVAVEQYRGTYIFLAPSDYDVSFVDIVGPTGSNVTVDNGSVGAFMPIGSSGFGVARFKLPTSASGSHTLKSDKPVGIQVMGYGSYTSYQYPGGSNLSAIAPPPVN